MPPDTGALTVGDRLQRIEALQSETLSKVNDLDARDRADLQRFAHHESRLSRLESANVWLNRLVIGAVVLAALGAVLAGVGMNP